MSEDLSLSEVLRRAREARDESLEQVHQRTGIALKVLQGLESGDFNVVEPVYARLAIDHYASHLGLDGEAIGARLRDEVAATRPPPVQMRTSSTLATGSMPAPSPVADLIRSQPPGRLATIGVIFVLGLAIVLYLLGSDSPPARDTGSRPVPDRPVVSTPAPAVAPPQVQSPPVAVQSPPADTVVAAAGPVVDVPDPGEVSVETRAVLDSTGIVDGPLVLQVDAVDSTWVQVQWDDQDGVVEIIPSGESRTWGAQEFFMVRAGRAHGVHFHFQGELLGAGRLGDPTKVLRFHASAAGVQLLGPDLEPITPIEPVAQIAPDTTEAVGQDRP